MVFDPVAPPNDPMLPSTLIVAYEFSDEPVDAPVYSPAVTSTFPLAMAAVCFDRVLPSAVPLTTQPAVVISRVFKSILAYVTWSMRFVVRLPLFGATVPLSPPTAYR